MLSITLVQLSTLAKIRQLLQSGMLSITLVHLSILASLYIVLIKVSMSTSSVRYGFHQTSLVLSLEPVGPLSPLSPLGPWARGPVGPVGPWTQIGPFSRLKESCLWDVSRGKLSLRGLSNYGSFQLFRPLFQ